MKRRDGDKRRKIILKISLTKNETRKIGPNKLPNLYQGYDDLRRLPLFVLKHSFRTSLFQRILMVIDGYLTVSFYLTNSVLKNKINSVLRNTDKALLLRIQ